MKGIGTVSALIENLAKIKGLIGNATVEYSLAFSLPDDALYAQGGDREDICRIIKKKMKDGSLSGRAGYAMIRATRGTEGWARGLGLSSLDEIRVATITGDILSVHNVGKKIRLEVAKFFGVEQLLL